MAAKARGRELEEERIKELLANSTVKSVEFMVSGLGQHLLVTFTDGNELKIQPGFLDDLSVEIKLPMIIK